MDGTRGKKPLAGVGAEFGVDKVGLHLVLAVRSGSPSDQLDVRSRPARMYNEVSTGCVDVNWLPYCPALQPLKDRQLQLQLRQNRYFARGNWRAQENQTEGAGG